jgi:hypothetical protein
MIVDQRMITCSGRPWASRPHRTIIFLGLVEAACPLCDAIDEIDHVNDELMTERTHRILGPDDEVKLQKLGNRWTVTYGAHWEDELGWDEALGVMASILLGKSPQYLRTAEEHAALDSRYRNMALARLQDRP